MYVHTKCDIDAGAVDIDMNNMCMHVNVYISFIYTYVLHIRRHASV